MSPRFKRIRGVVLALLLAGTTLAVYWQVRQFEFTNYDDEDYVTRNAMVRGGMTWEGVAWALTTSHFSYWHPLTWMSHMLDCEWFGLEAGAHHLTNVFLHIAATLALFFALARMTRAWERSAIVAALFALHPLHVESVAWIAERKDVLSTLFWFLTLWAYAWYAERPGLRRYAVALFLFLLGLMSKPMLVTVPCVLLLMDYWPLKRLNLFPQRSPDQASAGWRGWLQAVHRQSVPSLARLLWEKVPFLALALASSAITFFAVWRSSRVFSVESVPIGLRLANTPISYVRYLGKMLLPEGLVVLYPMPARWETWEVAGAILLLLCLTGVVVFYCRRAPYLVMGWLWFLGTLVPTIGLIPVGWQSIADRYTYVPLVGLFIMVTWAVADLSRTWPFRQRVLGAATLLVLTGLALGTWQQTRHWRNNETLFRHAVSVSTNNTIAQYNLGLTLQQQGRWSEAAQHYYQAIQSNPRWEPAYNNLGFIFNQARQFDLATHFLEQGLKVNPKNTNMLANLGNTLAALGRTQEALARYGEALRLNPDFAEAHAHRGKALVSQGELEPGLAAFREALRLNPELFPVRSHLAWILATHPDPAFRNGQESLAQATQACALSSRQDASALLSLAAALAVTGQFKNASQTAGEAARVAESAGSQALAAKSKKLQQLFETEQLYVEKPNLEPFPP